MVKKMGEIFSGEKREKVKEIHANVFVHVLERV